MQQPRSAIRTDHDHAERIQRLASALNAAVRDAGAVGLAVDVGILSVETVALAVKVPQLTSRVVREIEVG